MPACRYVASVVLLALPSALQAQTVYKCVAHGETSYQQSPCATNQKQETIRLEVPGPTTAPAPMPAPPPRVADAAPPPLPPPAPRPPPRMYGCIRATDGKPYVSPTGQTQPYMAPFGMLGAVSSGLADAYGSPNAAVASAPELNRGKGNVGALVNSNYVWVQDSCRELSPTETCQVLRDDADANDKALRNAFSSQRAPFEAREAELRTQLASCR